MVTVRRGLTWNRVGILAVGHGLTRGKVWVRILSVWHDLGWGRVWVRILAVGHGLTWGRVWVRILSVGHGQDWSRVWGRVLLIWRDRRILESVLRHLDDRLIVLRKNNDLGWLLLRAIVL